MTIFLSKKNTIYRFLAPLNRFRYYGDDVEIQKKRLKKFFLWRNGYELNLDSPKTLNEKIQWLKFNYHDPLMTKCTDKYLVRDYVKKVAGEEFLVPLIAVFDSAEEIDFSRLPNKFILKVNHGSQQNIICRDKSKLNIRKTRFKLAGWMKPHSNHFFYSYEWSYKGIRPKIVCEELLDEKGSLDIRDLKVYCFNGRPTYVCVYFDFSTDLKNDYYSMSWERLMFERSCKNNSYAIPRPKTFDQMIELAKKLSKSFPLVRVDFYEVNGKLYVGELTFYPANGMDPYQPEEWDYKWGNMLTLPQARL